MYSLTPQSSGATTSAPNISASQNYFAPSMGTTSLLSGVGGLMGSKDPWDMFLTGGQGDAYKGMASGMGDIQDYLQKQLQSSQSGLLPYQQAGTKDLGLYQQALSKMSNPQQYVSNIMDSYQQSPQAKQQMSQAIKAANAAGEASGMVGSGAEQTALEKQAQQFTSADQQQYLQNILGVQSGYMGALKGVAGAGQQAATTAGGWGMDMSKEIADYMAQQQAAEAQARESQGSGIAGLIGGGMSLLSGLL